MLLKSHYVLIAGALAFFVSLMILSAFLTSAMAFSGMATYLADSVRWEVILAKGGLSEEIVSVGEVITLDDIVSLLPSMNSTYTIIKSTGYARDTAIIKGIYLEIWATSPNLNETCLAASQTSGSVGFLIVKGLNLSTPYAIWIATIGEGNWTKYGELLGLSYVPVSSEVANELDNMINYGSTVIITEQTGFMVATKSFSTGLRKPVFYVVVRAEDADEVLIPAMQKLIKVAESCGMNTEIVASWTIAFVDLKPSLYVNPASIQATMSRINSIANELQGVTGYDVAYTPEAEQKLGMFVAFESFMRFGIVMGLVPAVMAVMAATPSMAESAILSVRRAIGLIRLRGIPGRKLKTWLLLSTFVAGLAGIALSFGVFVVIGQAVTGGNLNVAMSVITDAFIMISTIVAAGITLTYLGWKALKVAYSISPNEAVKTVLAPESLLEPVKMGKLGWFSLTAGLYFVITGFAGFSAQVALIKVFSSGEPPNIGLIIGLVILAGIEGFLKPFSPILLAYGFAKLVTAHYEKVMGALMTKVFKGSKYGLAAKGLASAMRRRGNAVVMLTIFSMAIITQAFISTAYMTSATETATLGSVGAEIFASKDTYVHSFSELATIIENISSDYQGKVAVVATFDMLMRYTSQSVEYTDHVFIVVVNDPDNLLLNTYWFNEWGDNKPFKELLREVAKDGKALIVRTPTVFSFHQAEIKEGTETELESYDGTSVTNVTIVGSSRGFPGKPLISIGERGLVVGPWFIEKARSGGLGESPFGYIVRIGVYSMDPAIADALREDGFRVVTKETVTENPGYKLTTMLFSSSSTDLVSSTVILALTAVVAGLVAWTVSREIRRVFVLLRVRGVTSGGVTKVILMEWGTIAFVATLVGVIAGGAFGIGITATYSAGGITPFTALSGIGIFEIDMSMAVPKVSLPAEAVLSTLVVFMILMVVPSFFTLKTYVGSVRERFIEVR